MPNDTREAALDRLCEALGSTLAETTDTEEFENELMSLLMEVGRRVFVEHAERLKTSEPFEEGGVRWSIAIHSYLRVATSFGHVTVARPLFRDRRNGPTRCPLSEQLSLVRDMWSPRLARVAALASTELTLERTVELLREMVGSAPSPASLHRLQCHLSALWEDEREEHEAAIRAQRDIPEEASSVAVSLDGVMVHMVGSDRATKVARAKGNGQAAKGPSGYKEASVGVLTYYDAQGERLSSIRSARMPEPNKETLKAWIAKELAHIRTQRSDLTVVAIADGAANNWSFLTELHAGHEVVDFFHTAEHLHRHMNKANGASTVDTQAKLKEMRRKLQEEEDGAAAVFAELTKSRVAAGTEPTSTRKKKGRRQPTYFERHKDRMNYSTLQAMNLPIGSGVTEGTCKHLVVDRLRRAGMRWSEQGGQAVLTLRSLAVSGDFTRAWERLRDANSTRFQAVA